MNPKPNHRVSVRKGEDEKTHGGDRRGETGAETSVMCLVIQGAPGMARPPLEVRGTGHAGLASGPPEGITPADALMSDFQPPELGENKPQLF